MKHLRIIIAAAFLAGLFASCNKFLEETPKSQEPIEAFYQTDNQVQSAVNALYVNSNGPASFYAAQGWFDATWVLTLDNMAGMSRNPVQQNPNIKYFASLTQTPELVSNYVGSMWSNLYASINNCNTIITRVEANGGGLSAEVKNQALATARFFRAFDYYFLVRLFGDVPIVTKPIVSSSEDISPARNKTEDVYKLITADLEWALANGNLADVPMGSNGNKISKGTVACVLSEVYLTMAGYPLKKGNDYYTKALSTARTVISNGAYQLFSHGDLNGNSAFDKLRLTQFDKGSEYLYFVESDPAIRASGYPIWSFPSTFPKPIPNSPVQVQYSITTLSWEPQSPLLNLYDDGGNDIRRRNRQFFHDKFIYNGSDGKPHEIKLDFTSPFRWYDSTAIFGTGTSGKYTAVYRLADVLLIAAEAANELTNDPTPYLSPILKRAYEESPNIPAGQNERRNLILAERFRELAMEGHTWFDMLRTRLYPDADAQHHVTFSPLLGHDNGRGQKYSEKDMLLPLPPSEMQRNPNLRPQNPGY